MSHFEMEHVIEELAKAYPAQCATTWFKITKNHKPSEEEYRNKVVEYMRQFEYLIATYPKSIETEKLKDLVKKSLAREIEKVLKGNNNDVERRHKHYVANSPSVVLTKEEKSQKNIDNTTAAQEEEEQQQKEIQYKDNSEVVDKRRRKKKLMMVSE
jgi:hypothetical protein